MGINTQKRKRMRIISLPTLNTKGMKQKLQLKLISSQIILAQVPKGFPNIFFVIFQFCSLGRLSHEVGWKYQDVVATLETKRRVKAEAYYKKAKAVEKVRQQVKKDTKVAKRIASYQKVIESYGYA